jgi:threonylcarbamoyladenosine tRNA methylthiotransferase MtaB
MHLISYLHVFTYSERENTLASTLPGSVPGSQRSDRSKMLHILSDKKRRKFYEENLDSSYTVLFENDIEDGMMHGFTENYIRVAAKYDPLLVNELKTVKLASINAKGHVEVEEVVSEFVAH